MGNEETDPTEEVKRLRAELRAIYEKAGELLWKSKIRSPGHICDYRAALQSIKDRAKKALRPSVE